MSDARRLLSALQLLSLLMLAGCATQSPPSPAASSLLPSRDGTLRYRMPSGWFDAGEDTLSADRKVWLVRADYAGSLTVRRVHMRALEKSDFEGPGLLQIARLAAALETSRQPGVLAREPDRCTAGGHEAVSYDVEYPGSGDRTRTVILPADGRVYAVTALVNGAAPAEAAAEIFGVLESFLGSLRW